MATDPKKKADGGTATVEAPEGWRPDPGDVLSGEVTEVAKGWSDYTDSYYPIVTLRTDDGKMVNVHCFHEILKERMLDARPVVGTKLEVECLGEKRTRDDKRSYVGYRVTVPGETGENVWADLREGRRRAGASARPQRPQQESLDSDIPF